MNFPDQQPQQILINRTLFATHTENEKIGYRYDEATNRYGVIVRRSEEPVYETIWVPTEQIVALRNPKPPSLKVSELFEIV